MVLMMMVEDDLTSEGGESRATYPEIAKGNRLRHSSSNAAAESVGVNRQDTAGQRHTSLAITHQDGTPYESASEWEESMARL